MTLAAAHGMSAGYHQWPFKTGLWRLTAAQRAWMSGVLEQQDADKPRAKRYDPQELREHMKRQEEKRAARNGLASPPIAG